MRHRIRHAPQHPALHAAVPDHQQVGLAFPGQAYEDIRRVVKEAKKLGGRVAMGGHSLGGSITTAYATWDFHGKSGASDLWGLVYIDGGSSPAPVTPDAARASLQTLSTSTPWLTFGGIPAPLAGLFNTSGALSLLTAPTTPRSAGPGPPCQPT